MTENINARFAGLNRYLGFSDTTRMCPGSDCFGWVSISFMPSSIRVLSRTSMCSTDRHRVHFTDEAPYGNWYWEPKYADRRNPPSDYELGLRLPNSVSAYIVAQEPEPDPPPKPATRFSNILVRKK